MATQICFRLIIWWFWI